MGAPKLDDNDDDVVLKLDMHCSGCVKKLKKFVRSIDGVEAVKVNSDLNKLTVTGKVDPSKLRETLASKTNKKVDLVSPQPSNKPPSAVANTADEAVEKPSPPLPAKPKEGEKKEAPKPKPEVQWNTVVLKMKLHCDGCIQKIRKIIARYKGVQDVDIDGAKNLVKVTGTMDLKELLPYLVEKLRRNVELVQNAKKDNIAGGGNKNVDNVTSPVENAGGGGNIKKGDKALERKKGKETNEASNGDEVVKLDAQKMMHQPNYGIHNFNYNHAAAGPSNLNWYNGGYGGHYNHPRRDNEMIWGDGERGVVTEEGNVGYVMEHFQYQNHPAPPEPGLFSDENPNGCSVM